MPELVHLLLDAPRAGEIAAFGEVEELLDVPAEVLALLGGKPFADGEGVPGVALVSGNRLALPRVSGDVAEGELENG